VNAQCIPVAGLEFERISDQELLAIKNGKNFAVLTISTDDSRYQRYGEECEPNTRRGVGYDK
jgi:hypothetical protein